MPVGAIAVSGSTGGGKSSLFAGSNYVHDILITDPGSIAQHKLYHRGRPDDIQVFDPYDKDSPVNRVCEHARKARTTGRPFVLDSFTALTEQQIAWKKRVINRAIYQKDYQEVVGDLRDCILILAQSPAFVLFNTAPGGIVSLPDGTKMKYPVGSLVGLPSMTGVGANSESMLARFSASWVVFRGFRGEVNGTFKDIPRGFLLPHKDLRPQETANYTPIKDPYGVLREGKVKDESGAERTVDVDPFLPIGQGCSIDQFLERIAEKFPPPGAAVDGQQRVNATVDLPPESRPAAGRK